MSFAVKTSPVKHKKSRYAKLGDRQVPLRAFFTRRLRQLFFQILPRKMPAGKNILSIVVPDRKTHDTFTYFAVSRSSPDESVQAGHIL